MFVCVSLCVLARHSNCRPATAAGSWGTTHLAASRTTARSTRVMARTNKTSRGGCGKPGSSRTTQCTHSQGLSGMPAWLRVLVCAWPLQL